jgi:vacuolar iron transporter family protein
MIASSAWIAEVSSATAIVELVFLGGTAAYAGGAPIAKGAMRVTFWGVLAMGLTASVGRLFGTIVEIEYAARH